jgi:hypothetical protein
LTSVQFDEPENQLFKTMQNLYRQPAGACTVVTGRDEPQVCQMELVSATPIPEGTRQRFLAAVFSKPIYLRTEEAQLQIHRRHQTLLEAAAPEIESSKGASKRRKVVAADQQSVDRTATAELASPTSAPQLDPESELVERYRQVGLPRAGDLVASLKEAQQFFDRGNWKVSVFNSRLALERVLSDVAVSFSEQTKGALRRDPSPLAARTFLNQVGILDENTTKMIATVYRFHSGPMHPQDSQTTSEDARLSLDLVNSIGVFVLQRFEAKLTGDARYPRRKPQIET